MNNKSEQQQSIKFMFDSHPEHIVQLGEVCTFTIAHLPEKVCYQLYLKFQHIQYPDPIQNWTSNSQFSFRPEALGDYTIMLKHISEELDAQWLLIDFHVGVENRLLNYNQPTLVEKRDNVDWWASSNWEAAFYVSHEKNILEKLVKIIQPGWVIYDIGANIGFHAMQFSLKTGNKGRVYCFEPNPLMVYFMQVNFSKNKLKNTEIIPLAITDMEKKIDFRINPGNSLVSLGNDSKQFSSKTGMSIAVQGMNLDEIIIAYKLRVPDLIKLDIEGAEGQALTGMKNTLSIHQPLLLLEVHGKEPAINCFALLDELHYRYVDANSNQHYNNKIELLKDYPNKVALYYCIPQSNNLFRS